MTQQNASSAGGNERARWGQPLSLQVAYGMNVPRPRRAGSRLAFPLLMGDTNANCPKLSKSAAPSNVKTVCGLPAHAFLCRAMRSRSGHRKTKLLSNAYQSCGASPSSSAFVNAEGGMGTLITDQDAVSQSYVLISMTPKELVPFIWLHASQLQESLCALQAVFHNGGDIGFLGQVIKTIDRRHLTRKSRKLQIPFLRSGGVWSERHRAGLRAKVRPCQSQFRDYSTSA